MSAATASAVSRETVAAISPGDAVELGDEHYRWANALDVVDADAPVEWDVPFGEDWWTRTIIVEGSGGGQYGVVATADGDGLEVDSYQVEDGDLASKRGAVVHLVRVEDATDQDDEETLDPDAVRPDGLTEACVHSVAEYYETFEEVADDFGVDVDRAEAILDAHDCSDEVVLDA